MDKSTKSKAPSKRPGFPLFPHSSGQWAKKVCKKTVYFGVWAEPQKALERWLKEKDDLLAGRTPGRGEGLTISELVDQFLTSKKSRVVSGELTAWTWHDYYKAGLRLVQFFGKGAKVLSLRPADFEQFRAHLAETRGPVSMNNSVKNTRTLFNWAFTNELIEKPFRFGDSFSPPPKKVMRKAKREAGSKVFTAAEVRNLIRTARHPLKAMILLGINCAFGQSDVASLTLAITDLKAAMISYSRPKTETIRQCPLWPETVKAIRQSLAKRVEPKDQVHAGLVFLTHHGNPWIRKGQKAGSEKLFFNDYIACEFRKLARKLGVKRRGSFYNLRHTFRTAADGSKDQPAIDMIMGHTRGDMAEEYRDRISLERLRDVAEFVRGWLGLQTKRPAKITKRRRVGKKPSS